MRCFFSTGTGALTCCSHSSAWAMAWRFVRPRNNPSPWARRMVERCWRTVSASSASLGTATTRALSRT